MQHLLQQAEQCSREGNSLLNDGDISKALESFKKGIEFLNPLRGWAFGEVTAVRCFLGQAKCFLASKEEGGTTVSEGGDGSAVLSNREKALKVLTVALTIPSICQEPSLWAEVLHLKAAIHNDLKQYQLGIITLDRAIGLGVGNSAEFLELRGKLVDNFKATNITVIEPVPKVPTPLSPNIVQGAIVHIFQHHCKPSEVIPPLARLAELRGNFDVRDSQGNNFLWAVCQCAMQMAAEGHTDPDTVLPVLQFLYAHGVRSEQRFPRFAHRTPLQMLVMAGAVDCVKFTIQAGGGVHTCDDNGWNPLIVCCAPDKPYKGDDGRYLQILQGLISAGAVVDPRTKQGLTPLTLSCQCGDSDAVEVLLAHGASLTQRCLMGFSAVVWTCIGSRGECIPMGEKIPDDSKRATGAARCYDLLMDRASHFEKYESPTGMNLHEEFQEDVKCFLVSKLLSTVRVTQLNYMTEKKKSGALDLAVDATDIIADIDSALATQIVTKIFTVTGVSVSDTGDLNDNRYYRLFTGIKLIIPQIFLKHWQCVAAAGGAPSTAAATSTVTASDEKVEATTTATPEAGNAVQPAELLPTPPDNASVSLTALANRVIAEAPMIHRAWLNILTLSVFAPAVDIPALTAQPGRPTLVPPILLPFETITKHNYDHNDKSERYSHLPTSTKLIAGIYSVFKLLVQDILSRRYSCAVPTAQLLSQLADHAPLLQLTHGHDEDSDNEEEVKSPASEKGEVERCYWRDLLEKNDVDISTRSVFLTTEFPEETSTLFFVLPDLLQASLSHHRSLNPGTLSVGAENVFHILELTDALVAAIGLYRGKNVIVVGELDLAQTGHPSPFVQDFGENNINRIANALTDSGFQCVDTKEMLNWPFERNVLSLWSRS